MLIECSVSEQRSTTALNFRFTLSKVQGVGVIICLFWKSISLPVVSEKKAKTSDDRNKRKEKRTSSSSKSPERDTKRTGLYLEKVTIVLCSSDYFFFTKGALVFS
jgi:hypothetical protein